MLNMFHVNLIISSLDVFLAMDVFFETVEFKG